MKRSLSPYMTIKRIEFIVTYQCSGSCRHCFMDKTKRRAEMPAQIDGRAAAVIEALSAFYDIESVMTFGGEPLLYPDAVCAIHAKASSCGVKTRQVITNGYFTKDDRYRREVANRLAEAGVNDLLLSVDAFHQATIPVEAVRAFARDLMEADIPSIRLHPSWVVSAAHDNSYNAATRALLAGFDVPGLSVSAGNSIFLTGNAAEFLSEYYEKPGLDLSETCGARPYTEPLTDITSLSIEPNGDAAICNFSIGNIFKEDITDIISRYDPHRHAVMRALLTGGAAALADYAESVGMAVDPSRYRSVCDLCRDVARFVGKTVE